MLNRIVPALVALVLLVGCAAGPGVGAKAPSFSAADADGTVVSLASYDDKVLILDFWAVW